MTTLKRKHLETNSYEKETWATRQERKRRICKMIHLERANLMRKQKKEDKSENDKKEGNPEIDNSENGTSEKGRSGKG